jgi:uracil-DNA glycosylase
VQRDDGLELRGVYIMMPCRCVPPDNRPAADELERCRAWFVRELTLMPMANAFLALGAIAWQSLVGFGPNAAHRFAHGAEAIVNVPPTSRTRSVVASYHVSQQNTQTGRLTKRMFDEVLGRAMQLAGLKPRHSIRCEP